MFRFDLDSECVLFIDEYKPTIFFAKSSNQDRVPAFSTVKVKNLIEMELGSPIDVLFKEFEDLPIAAASLGQVFTLCLHFPPFDVSIA